MSGDCSLIQVNLHSFSGVRFLSTLQLPPRQSVLAQSIVSTDAIEQLDPLVPESSRAEHHASLPRMQMQDSWKRQFGFAQQLLTTLPLMLADLVSLLSCFYLTSLLVSVLTGFSAEHDFVLQGIAVALVYVGVGSQLGLFPATAVSPVYELKQLVTACWISFSILLVLNYLLARLSNDEIIVGVVGGFLASCFVPLTRTATRHYCVRVRWWGERVIVIGSGPQGQAIYQFYNRARQRGLRPVGIVEIDDSRVGSAAPLQDSTIPLLGSLSQVAKISEQTLARWAIVAPGGCGDLDMSQVMRCAASFPNLVILPMGFLLPSLWASPHECAGVMGIHFKDHLRNPLARCCKRSIDIILSICGLIAFSPLFIVVIAWIKLKSPGDAFYGHRRIGRGGKSFVVRKFRTMIPDAAEVLDEHLERDPEMRQEWFRDQKLKNDPRVITGIGNFLRRWSLDELPQLWNVLVGDMSLVGPRPIVTAEIEKYQDLYPLYLRVRPGITGLWQVSGRNDTSYEQRVRLDGYYVCNWSGWLDYYILLRTVRTLCFREGAY